MKIVSRFLVGLIKVYQVLLSPFFGQQCRFYPTCSHYAIEAVSYTHLDVYKRQV